MGSMETNPNWIRGQSIRFFSPSSPELSPSAIVNVLTSSLSFMSNRLCFVLVLGVCLVSALPMRLVAQGLPEPGLVHYGALYTQVGGKSVRWDVGTLEWRLSTRGQTFVVRAFLTNLLDQFSYVVVIPCETPVPGLNLSTNALALNGDLVDRTTISVLLPDGSRGQGRIRPPATGTFALNALDRGKAERIDIDVVFNFTDSDGNGLPDVWERAYFNRIGIDPRGDPDLDGVSTLDEFLAGTNPLLGSSLFRFITTSRLQSGAVVLEWASLPGKSYSIDRASEIQGPFQDLGVTINGSGGASTTYQDDSASQRPVSFYRVRLNP